jgi:urease alpha subunit
MRPYDGSPAQKESQMVKKIVIPVLVAGALFGGALSAGTASATTPTTTVLPATTAAPATSAANGHQAGRAWLRAHRRRLRREGAAISAKAIGVTTKALVTELRTGKSVAEVATEHGVSVTTVVNALVSAADARVDQAVAKHTLTLAQAAAIKAKLPALATKAVDHVFK